EPAEPALEELKAGRRRQTVCVAAEPARVGLLCLLALRGPSRVPEPTRAIITEQRQRGGFGSLAGSIIHHFSAGPHGELVDIGALHEPCLLRGTMGIYRLAPRRPGTSYFPNQQDRGRQDRLHGPLRTDDAANIPLREPGGMRLDTQRIHEWFPRGNER